MGWSHGTRQREFWGRRRVRGPPAGAAEAKGPKPYPRGSGHWAAQPRRTGSSSTRERCDLSWVTCPGRPGAQPLKTDNSYGTTPGGKRRYTVRRPHKTVPMGARGAAQVVCSSLGHGGPRTARLPCIGRDTKDMMGGGGHFPHPGLPTTFLPPPWHWLGQWQPALAPVTQWG